MWVEISAKIVCFLGDEYLVSKASIAANPAASLLDP